MPLLWFSLLLTALQVALWDVVWRLIFSGTFAMIVACSDASDVSAIAEAGLASGHSRSVTKRSGVSAVLAEGLELRQLPGLFLVCQYSLMLVFLILLLRPFYLSISS